jgi:hypothetical protein
MSSSALPNVLYADDPSTQEHRSCASTTRLADQMMMARSIRIDRLKAVTPANPPTMAPLGST